MRKYRNEAILEEVEKASGEVLSQRRMMHHRDHFFPAIIKKLDYQFAAEIGVDKGGFSNHLISKSNLRKIFCVDPWIDNFGSGYIEVDFHPEGDARMKEAQTLLKPYIEVDRAELIRATGLEASAEFPDGYLDFVYIDADHSLEGIFHDIYAWTPKVRVGGIVAGHDYKDGPDSGMKDYWGKGLDFHVKTVVDHYCDRYGYKLHSVGGRIMSWWFVKI